MKTHQFHLYSGVYARCRHIIEHGTCTKTFYHLLYINKYKVVYSFDIVILIISKCSSFIRDTGGVLYIETENGTSIIGV